MFSDVDNEERMKKTRRDRHKKYLLDFEMDNIVEKDNDSENEAEKESNIERVFGSEEIKTKIQNNKSAEENEKLIRKRIYDSSDYNSDDNCPVKLKKSPSNIIESISIKKWINIPYTQEVIMPDRNNHGELWIHK